MVLAKGTSNANLRGARRRAKPVPIRGQFTFSVLYRWKQQRSQIAKSKLSPKFLFPAKANLSTLGIFATH